MFRVFGAKFFRKLPVPSAVAILLAIVLSTLLVNNFMKLELYSGVITYTSTAYSPIHNFVEYMRFEEHLPNNTRFRLLNTSSANGFNDSVDISIHFNTDFKNTSQDNACVFPKFDPFEPSVMKVAGLDKKVVVCKGSYPPDLTYVCDNVLLVNVSRVKKNNFTHCQYRNILRSDLSDKSFTYSEWKPPFTVKIDLPAQTEYIEVQCLNRKSEIVSKTYFSLIPRKRQHDETNYVNLKKRQVEYNPKETLNVVMVSFDSVSRYQFLRSFKKTYSFLMDKLHSFDLSKHTQVGRNTFPNLLPLFTGRSYHETSKWWNESLHMDAIDMMWRTFENAGYSTFLTQDNAYGAAFHYLKKGFFYPFARYFSRPLALAMEKDTDIKRSSRFCAGNWLEAEYHLDYFKRFIDTFSDKPYFGAAVLVKVTHDDITNAKMLDPYLHNFYTSLNDKGYLNKTLLISFSDHGPRFGVITSSVNGPYEKRTPYTILTFPEWFLKKYPDVAENLKVNTKRLTTHFDTHATLLDLLYFKSNNPPPLPPQKNGISLFKKIPANRTCEDAHISREFCVCGQGITEKLDVNSNIAQELASLVLQTLNSKRDPELCAVFTVKKTLSVGKVFYKNITTNSLQFHYNVKLKISPGGGIYEGNVYMRNSTFWEVGNQIDRLNMYKSQSACVKNNDGQLFCFCKNLLKNK